MKNPKLIVKPFAKNGQKNVIPENYETSMESNQATWDQGFSQITMLPVSAGGLPPKGQDFNGIFNQISENIVYLSQGGRFKFSAEYAEAIGGYPKGATLQSDDEKKEYLSLIDNNKVDFNTAADISASWKLVNTDDLLAQIASKQPKGDYATKTELNSGLAGKQPTGDYATKTEVNSKLAKDQNGADIPNKPKFIENLGLPEVSANGKNFVSDGGHRRITAGDGIHQAVLSDTGYFGVKDKDGSVWEFNPSGVLIAGSVPVSRLTGTDEITVPVGTVIMVAHNKQVAGRLLRTNGTAVSRTAYADLFAAIGTTYGAGDGSTTFNLPDTRDDFPRFAGDSRSVGSKQGDAMRNIVGSYATAKPNTSTILSHASGPFKIVEDTSQWYSVQTAPSVGGNFVMRFDLENTNLPLASENRPRNIAFAGWIRY